MVTSRWEEAWLPPHSPNPTASAAMGQGALFLPAAQLTPQKLNCLESANTRLTLGQARLEYSSPQSCRRVITLYPFYRSSWWPRLSCLLLWQADSLPLVPLRSRDAGSIPGLGRSSGGKNGKQIQYSCLENSMDRGAWRGHRRVRHDWAARAPTCLMVPAVKNPPAKAGDTSNTGSIPGLGRSLDNSWDHKRVGQDRGISTLTSLFPSPRRMPP